VFLIRYAVHTYAVSHARECDREVAEKDLKPLQRSPDRPGLMPISIPAAAQRVLGLGAAAFVATLALSLWFASRSGSKKKKEIQLQDSREKETLVEEKSEEEVTKMEVMVQPSEDILQSCCEAAKDEEEVLSETYDDDKPASRCPFCRGSISC
jgi:hypothetical protein